MNKLVNPKFDKFLAKKMDPNHNVIEIYPFRKNLSNKHHPTTYKPEFADFLADSIEASLN
jgi:hypothetical protein